MLWWLLSKLTFRIVKRDLRSSDPLYRVRAAEELGNTRNPRAIKPLLATLCDDDAVVRRAANTALIKLGDAQAVTVLAWIPTIP